MTIMQKTNMIYMADIFHALMLNQIIIDERIFGGSRHVVRRYT
jgi:hypothetical protein